MLTNKKFINAKYPQYFAPEIKAFKKQLHYSKQEGRTKFLIEGRHEETDDSLPPNFYELRREGENENQICKLIRNDMIDEFIVYVNKHNVSIDSSIKDSIYETNCFLIKNQIISGTDRISYLNRLTPIKYAAFFGSIQIFKYLKLNGADLSPSIWLYAIHGHNAEIIHLLEEDNIKSQDDASYLDYYLESIKCHHNDIANYFLNNFFQSNDENLLQFTLVHSLKCYNFAFIEDSLIKEQLFILCKYDYSILVDILMKNFDVKLNSKMVTDNTIHN